MDEQRVRERGPARWWHPGPPWWSHPDAIGTSTGTSAGSDTGPGPGAGIRRPRLPWRSTLLLTVLVLVGSNFAAHTQPHREHLDAYARLLLLATCALLLWRHRQPVTVAFGTAGLALAYLAAGYPYGPVFAAVAVACFSAVVAGHRRAAWAALGMLWAGHLLISLWLYRWLPPPGDGGAGLGQELIIATWVLIIVSLAELVRLRREQWARERADRAQAARRRADEERLRIARELHDVLAHSISVINVQAGMGLALLDSDPEQARSALTTIKAASKEALGEVRQVLDTLRAPGDVPRAPAPGLGRLPELVEQAASAGLAVDVTGKPPRLAAGADLAAFRIVQEALTNVVRHSGSRHARVRLEHGGGELRLRIDDDGPATGAVAGGSGNGLAGMRERAAALGGTIEAGPRADGGFRVLAVLPFGDRDARGAGDTAGARDDTDDRDEREDR
ncbi:sensor histidine kinase [Streptomyces sp. Ag109_O5-10]|uniref:sensor histidine kinase n=1 Tax=Streptomyces sp. Ag109_O5-10 TaxID=1855349 RepID=UPI00089460E5|nr:sensor histidine kinase [Streptomyces sp. Ag109_O5-10]SED90263.1 Signal transduction histidine kinase [Streptomyces sp. Ag109_O5-10]